MKIWGSGRGSREDFPIMIVAVAVLLVGAVLDATIEPSDTAARLMIKAVKDNLYSALGIR
jgi:hypothetical protein